MSLKTDMATAVKSPLTGTLSSFSNLGKILNKLCLKFLEKRTQGVLCA